MYFYASGQYTASPKLIQLVPVLAVDAEARMTHEDHSRQLGLTFFIAFLNGNAG